MTFFASRRKTYDNYRAGDPPAQCVSAEDPIDVTSEQLFEEDIDRDFLESLGDIVDAYANDRDFLEASAEADEHPPLPFEFTRVFFAHPEKKRRRAKLNKTITAQLMWQAKHSITNAAMKNFVAMARAPWFNSSELRSGNTLRRTREYFPLLPLYLLNVKTDELPYYNDKGVYVEESSKEFPFFSIVDVTTRFLQTPGIIDSITVGAELGPVCKEQCYGRQSRESPHFTYDRIQTEAGLGSYELGQNFMYDSNGKQVVCLLSGIVHSEVTGEMQAFVRLYAYNERKSRKRKEILPKLILTEEEHVLSVEDLNARLTARVGVLHIPSCGLQPGCEYTLVVY